MLATPLAAQTDLWQLDGTAVGLPDKLGFAVAGVGGYACVGAPFGQNPLTADTGAIWGVRWSRAGGLSMVWPFPKTGSGTANAEFGASIAGLGSTEMVVGAPVETTTPLGQTGAAMRMTATGANVSRVDGTGVGFRTGDGASSAGDVDGDGTVDLLVWATYASRAFCWPSATCNPSQVLVHVSNSSSPIVARIDGVGCVGYNACALSWVGLALSPLGNVNGAPGDEFLVSTQNPDQVLVYTWDAASGTVVVDRADSATATVRALAVLHDLVGSGSLHYARGLAGNVVEIVDATDGTVWRTLRANTSQGIADFGQTLANVGDQDGDGADDLLVGAPTTASGDGAAFLYSGATQELLHVFRPRLPAGRFGQALARVDDQTGDNGRPEILIGAPATTQNAGRALLFSLDPNLPDSVLYGQGCTPSGTSGLLPLVGTPSGPPRVGSNFHLSITRAPCAQPTILFLAFASFLPPIDLTPAGQPGCLLYPDALGTGFTFTPAINSTTTSTALGEGFGEVAFPFPAMPGLVGLQLHAQWFVFDPTTGPAPGMMTQPLRMTIR